MSSDGLQQCINASTPSLEKSHPAEDWTIRAKGLGKSYLLWKRPQDRLKQGLRWALPRWLPLREKTYYREFWALRGVDFQVNRGETIGIVGRNGSGKSTLLQIVCGTLRKTCGELKTSGRISALLELGSGFNPEFSGRDNVFLNAAILGLSEREIVERYDNILDFADIGEFIDQPLKHYSSGMRMRLAFAVAINVSPDILIVDEALAVGDEMFKRKCFAAIRAFQKAGGTILFVSHSSSIVIDLCSRAILLDAGELICKGSPKSVVANYHKLLNASGQDYHQLREGLRGQQVLRPEEPAASTEPKKAPPKPANRQQTRPRDRPYYDPNLSPKSVTSYIRRGAKIRDWIIRTPDGTQVNNLLRGDEYIYSYVVEFYNRCYEVRFAMLIKTVTGFQLGGAVSHTLSQPLTVAETGTSVTVSWRFRCTLLPAVYFMNSGVLGQVDGTEAYLDRWLDVLAFRVIPEKDLTATSIVDFGIKCSIEDEKIGSDFM